MLCIADMDKIEIRVDVGENDFAAKAKLGDSAPIDLPAEEDLKRNCYTNCK
jgi:elongation factor P hydroxylase